MGTSLLTWNPDRRHWEDLDETAERVRQREDIVERWNTGNTTGYQAHLALGYEEAERIICFRKALGTGDGAG